MSIATEFPTRPLTVTAPRVTRLHHWLLPAVAFGGCGIFLLVFFAPELVRLHAISMGPHVVLEGRVVEQECREAGSRSRSDATRFRCRLNIAYAIAGRDRLLTSEQNFSKPPPLGHRVRLVHSVGDPTLAAPVDDFASRWVTTAFVGAGVAILFLLLLLVLLRLRRDRRIANELLALDGQQLTPIEVDTYYWKRSGLWHYWEPGKRKRSERYRVVLGRGREPFFLGERPAWGFSGSKTTRALAVKGPNEGAPLLLDSELACLGLTEEERRQSSAWRDAQTPTPRL